MLEVFAQFGPRHRLKIRDLGEVSVEPIRLDRALLNLGHAGKLQGVLGVVGQLADCEWHE